MGTVRVALAQLDATVGDLGGNARRIAEAIAQARDAGAGLVVTPELALCGYPPEDLLLKPSFLADCGRALDQVVAATGGIAALVGFPHRGPGDAVYNAAALAADGRLLGVYHKLELPNYGVFDEARYFAPGRGLLGFELNGLRLCVTICEDLWVPQGQALRNARRNASGVVVNLSASPFHAGKLAERRQVLARFAARAGAFVAYANLVGGQDELVFDGGSLVLDPRGEVVAAAKRFQEDLLLADIRRDEVQARDLPRRVDGRWEKRVALRFPAAEGRKPLAPRRVAPLGRIEEVRRGLVLGIADYARKNGFRRAVVGLSGGVDSSLTAALAAEALGPDNVVGATMPSPYTSKETLGDAALLAGNLGVALITVGIQPIFQAYLAALLPHFGAGEGGIECENLQARIRGNILMALSNRFGWLVLTTGNKSETAVGYCTLYGDTAGGFAAIKDVPKTLVYELAEHVNRRAGSALIPRGVLHRAPSAELRPGQKDADSLPPYAQLDPILRAYVEEDRAPDEIAGLGFDMARVRQVVRLVDRSEYKRRQAPPGVKITPKAFGRDRRLPITNRYGNGSAP
ncbi:MAG: NAD+ synthase [Candidatus Brocadiia bacterium]